MPCALSTLAKPLPVKPLLSLSIVPSTLQKPACCSCRINDKLLAVLDELAALELGATELVCFELAAAELAGFELAGVLDEAAVPQRLPLTVATVASPVPWKPKEAEALGARVAFQLKGVAA